MEKTADEAVVLESANSRRYPQKFDVVEQHRQEFSSPNSAIEWLKHNKELMNGSLVFQIRRPDESKPLLDDVEIMRRLRV